MLPVEADADIRAHLAAGDLGAAATLTIRRLGPSTLGYLRCVLRDVDEADDAFARWAEGVWTSLAGFRGESSVETWSHRVAWRAALRVLRDPFRRRREALGSSHASHLADEIRASTAPHLGTTAQDRIAALKRELPAEDQTLLFLRLDRDLSWREVALVLAEEAGVDVSEAALRKRYERIKARVRELAIDAGLLPPA